MPLGEIPVYLTRSRYETKVLRHSQYVRWLSASTCYCVDQTGAVDPQCTACRGRGYIFKHQTVFDVLGENSNHCANKVFPAFTPIKEVLRVVRREQEYIIRSFTDTMIELGLSVDNVDQAYPNIGEVISVDYRYDTEKHFEGEVTYQTPGICVVPIAPIFLKGGGQVLGDLTRIISCRNETKAEDYTVLSFSRNEVYIDVSEGEPDPDDVIKINAYYVDPYLFMLMGVSEKKVWTDPFVASQGDAVMTVMYNVFIGEGDLIVQLVGEQRASAVLDALAVGVDAELPAFDVSRILRIDDASETVYVYGTDYILKRGNQIEWLAGGTKPTGKYSVQFLYHPTFRVFNVKPSVRTPENLYMPRKVSLQIYDKVNVNYRL